MAGRRDGGSAQRLSDADAARSFRAGVRVCGPALAAEKLPPLDAEFLEYLANFGSDEEDWTLFADEDEPATEPPPAKAAGGPA